MQTIDIRQIIIPPDRHRKEFTEEKLVELADSIVLLSLLQPIVLRDDGRTLVAGERRIRSLKTYVYPLGRPVFHNSHLMEPWHIPYVRLSDYGALLLEEAELAENVKRENLSWQERAAVEARIHKLRVTQREIAIEEGTATAAWTVVDTAQEVRGSSIGWYQTATKENIILAEHLDNPEVKKAKTPKEAIKILVRQEQTRRHSALAEAVGRTYSSDRHEAYNTDCILWMQNCATGLLQTKFDVILTDPPYGMGADQFGDAGGKLATIEHHYDDSYENWVKLMSGVDITGPTHQQVHPGWCKLSFDITKPEAHAYVFCDFDRFHELKFFMQAAGWFVLRTPIINVKEDGRVPHPDFGPRRVHEYCLYAVKGQKRTTGIFPDVVLSAADEQMGHGAQKPVSLYIDLLRRSVRPGDKVVDFFSGSGTIFPAATACQVHAVGIDSNAASYGKGLERLQALKAAERAQPSLAALVDDEEAAA